MTPDLTWPPEPQRWPPVFPPECACAWGDDRFGLWIDVVLGGPVQRFRWIEPGEFLMGSPEGEEGRDDNEGPQHLVRLMEGYWLAETACSQAVWQAVMGRNSSDFKDDPQNPVERVSWGEVQGFLREVDLRLPGVKAALPTEAEWEYACRAGSETVFSWGDGITAEQANYDATYSYTNGPTGKWREKTVAVRSFAPNAWGLYQMHGNVWEWCAGGWRDYDGEAQIDPRGPEGVICVLRGGSWINHGRFCRAAYRFRNDEPGHYFNWLGFRLALRSKGPEGLPEAVVAPEGPQGARDAANTEWQRDLSVSHGNIGDVLQAQGDGPGALAAYRNSHAIAEALAARDPANTEWQRDLSVSHNKIGDVLGAQGDGPGALAAYRNSLAIFEALAARDPANTEWQRDLSVSHDRIGDVLGAQGDGPGALAAYRKRHDIGEALAARDPANTEWQRDLSVSHNKIGDVLRAQGDGPGALAAYRKGLAIAEALAACDPANTGWQRDLSVSHDRVGDVLRAQGDGPGALAAYRNSLAIREALAARDPVNAQWQTDLAVSCAKLGSHPGLEIDARRDFLRRGLAILQRLKDAGRLMPSQDWTGGLSAALARLP